MAKASMEVLKASAEQWDVELTGGSVKAAAKTLHDFFVGEFGEDALAQCPVCGHSGPEVDGEGALVETCPYCGQKFVGEAEEKKTKKVKGEKKAKKVKVAKKRGVKEPEAEYIATVEQKQELESRVTRINLLRQSMAENAWEIGQELVVINDQSLWRGLGFESFFSYCQAELDFSRAMAYKYMLCSREFEKEEFQSLGVKKGELIASAPERHKPTLMKKAKKGASFTELRGNLNKLEGKSSPGPKKGAAGGMTLLGRVKEGDIHLSWLSLKTGKPITKPGVRTRFTRIQITDEIELVLVPTENELGMTANFRKIEEPVAAAETPPTE
jgi:uncharacterized Zn finger protein (UPF0148 family)